MWSHNDLKDFLGIKHQREKRIVPNTDLEHMSCFRSRTRAPRLRRATMATIAICLRTQAGQDFPAPKKDVTDLDTPPQTDRTPSSLMAESESPTVGQSHSHYLVMVRLPQTSYYFAFDTPLLPSLPTALYRQLADELQCDHEQTEPGAANNRTYAIVQESTPDPVGMWEAHVQDGEVTGLARGARTRWRATCRLVREVVPVSGSHAMYVACRPFVRCK
jgi:hypothetical protein